MAKQPPAPAGSLVTVATFSSMVEAQMGRAKLTAHGIRSFVSDEHLSTMNPQYIAVAGGIRLQVRRADVAPAEEVLREVAPEDEEEDNPEDGPPCPRCGKRYASLGLPPGLAILAVLLLGIPFLFLKKRWICGRCHHNFAPAEEPGERAHPYRAPRPAARPRR